MLLVDYLNKNVIQLVLQTVLLAYMNKSTFSDELEKFTSCNNVIDMDERSIHQGELALAIKDVESSGARVSCDFTIKAGSGRQVMFYFTEVFLGSPNRTERVDKACIEPKDVTGPYEIVPTGMRAIICSRTEVEIGSRVYTTAGSALSIRFYRNRGYRITVNFKLVFTAFRSGSCRTSERKCSNERCISHNIVCNGHNPCGDYSDCPTGLEHLSSWAMSGIVVLALLSGGIIIIMAGMCLQRAGSKRYDFDDITVPANGSLCHDHHHVEMNEVAKQATQSHAEKHEHSQFRDTQYKSCEGNDSRLLLQEYNHSLLEPPMGNDREKLIQSQRSSSENYSDEFDHASTQQDASYNPYHSYNDRKMPQNTFESKQYASSDFSTFQKNDFLVPEVAKPLKHTNITSQDGFYFSGNSLLYSDSESEGEEDRFKATSLDRKRPPPSHLKASNSHNGAICSEAPSFGDFKPPPPPYYIVKNKKVKMDKAVNKSNMV